MAHKCSKIELSGEDDLKASSGDWGITVSKSKVVLSELSSKKSWKSSKIVGFRCEGKSSGAHSIIMELESEEVELVQISNTKSALRFVEKIASHISVRFDEYTGRSVESDEHGMNVIEQIVTFPERWPALHSANYSIVQFTNIGRFICFTIPSVVQPIYVGAFFMTCLAGLIIGLPVSDMLYSGSNDILGFLLYLLPLTIVIVIWLAVDRNLGLLEAKHEVRMTSKRITVIPKFIGLFPLPARSWDIDNFRDLDVSSSGRLTFLFGDERLSCDMDISEAEWVFSEIANQLEILGLADRQGSEE